MNTPSMVTTDPQHSITPLMSLEEARKVIWLRNYPRPVGELYDEGYLNQSRLEWAVEKAYDPRLRQAAQFLLMQAKPIEKVAKKLPLELPDVALSIGITIERACSTEWPFSPFRGQPMGMLVETKQLSLKDLGYAAENAREERVRRAATALMLGRMNQSIKEPTPSAGFIKVLSGGRSYSDRRQYQIALIEGMIMGTVLGLAIAYFTWLLTRHPSAQSTMTLSEAIKSPIGIIALALLVGLFGLYFLGLFLLDRFILNRLDKQIDNFREGQKGEERVVEVILQTLDGNWSLFRNIQLPGRNKGDLDTVLVGPSGAWVLEIKNFSWEYRNIGEKWEYRVGNSWKLQKKSPSSQARNNAARLGNFLKADGIQQWVDAAVVWANQESRLTVENPSVAVWQLGRLPDELGNAWQEEKISAAKRSQIVEKLTKLCQLQSLENHKMSAKNTTT
jgi:hypothetical protein